ncbi:GDSL-type esterase/lipase family protein [Ureibacillus composti]|nr:GDSL-type esterase/lipase family protein [Ureibacillus composti]
MSKNKRKKRLSSFIIVVALIVMSFLLRSLTDGERYSAEGNGKPTSLKDIKIKVACVGDSITYGYGYPEELQRLLGTAYDVRNFGYSGRTAMSTGDYPYIKEEIYKESLTFSPKIVVIMFGTNDSKVQNWISKEEFKKQYRDLILSYTTLNSSPTVYLNTPATPYYIDGKTSGPMKFNIQKEKVSEVVEGVQELGKELGLEVININQVTKNHPEWFEKDGIHPNPDGAKAIASAVYQGITGT